MPSGSTRSHARTAIAATSATVTIVTATACGTPHRRSRFTAGMSVIARSAAATIGTSTGRATISVPTNANRNNPPRNTTSSFPCAGVVGPVVAAGGGAGWSAGGAAERAAAAVRVPAGPDPDFNVEAGSPLIATARGGHPERLAARRRSNRYRRAPPPSPPRHSRSSAGHGRAPDRASRRARAGAWVQEHPSSCPATTLRQLHATECDRKLVVIGACACLPSSCRLFRWNEQHPCLAATIVCASAVGGKLASNPVLGTSAPDRRLALRRGPHRH